ncbi:hypothetical protein Taro_032956, partial [Colocasia esculenta]|nr:hypothetical protein [Colocasia esculenta]
LHPGRAPPTRLVRRRHLQPPPPVGVSAQPPLAVRTPKEEGSGENGGDGLLSEDLTRDPAHRSHPAPYPPLPGYLLRRGTAPTAGGFGNGFCYIKGTPAVSPPRAPSASRLATTRCVTFCYSAALSAAFQVFGDLPS